MGVVRNILGFVVGIVLGSLVNMGVLMISWMLWPLPEGMDFNDPSQQQAFADYVASLPAAAFLLVLLAHLGQAAAGGWLAARIAEHPFALAMTIAGLTFAGSLYNLIVLPAPVWMWAELPLILGAGYFIGRAEAARRENLATSSSS